MIIREMQEAGQLADEREEELSIIDTFRAAATVGDWRDSDDPGERAVWIMIHTHPSMKYLAEGW